MAGRLTLAASPYRRADLLTGDGRILPPAPNRSHSAAYRGAGTIQDAVSVYGVGPVSRRVRLYDLRTGILLDETWSDTDGSYQFSSWDTGRDYLLIAIDHTGVYNAARAMPVTAQ